MKQVNKIVLKNFQCHEHTVLQPAPRGLTVITGPTDYGKSAVIRGLRWLFYNRPRGDDFIRHGSSNCQVTVELNTGDVITRRRTKSLNQYYVNDQLFEGFGNSVPREVQQVLGVYHYQIAGEELQPV